MYHLKVSRYLLFAQIYGARYFGKDNQITQSQILIWNFNTQKEIQGESLANAKHYATQNKNRSVEKSEIRQILYKTAKDFAS